MDFSAKSPRRRRRSSLLDRPSTSDSPQCNNFNPSWTSHSRKSSLQSAYSTATPRPLSSHDRSGDYGFASVYAGADLGGGLGSLADELAEDWDEDGYGDEGVLEIHAGKEQLSNGHFGETLPPRFEHENEVGMIGLAVTTPDRIAEHNYITSPSEPRLPSRTKKKRATYDGFDDGEYSDLENFGGISASLDARMHAVEELSRQGLEAIDSERSGTIYRVADTLKDLNSQAGIESHATRLATAYTALTAHLTLQIRVLATLTNPILSPLAVSPSENSIDLFVIPLSSLAESLPRASTSALPSLRALHTSTADILSTLSYLSDTLHMTRQTTNLAGRRLRATREILGSMQREADEAEEGRRWLQCGGWEEKLTMREAARVCGEVVEGFEEVCKDWRARIIEQNLTGAKIGAG